MWSRKIHSSASFSARSRKRQRTKRESNRDYSSEASRGTSEWNRVRGTTDISTGETRRVLKPNSIERNKSSRNEEKRGQRGTRGGGIKRKPWRGGGGGRTRRVSCKELEIKLRGKLDRIIVVSTLVCRIAWLHEGNARTISLLCKYYSHPWRLVKMVRSNKWYNKWKDDSSILWIS